MTEQKQNTEILDESDNIELLTQIVADIDAGNHETITATLEETHPAITANLIESLPQEHRNVLWEAAPEDQEAEILTHMRDDARDSVIDDMEEAELLAAAEAMEPGD